MKLFSTRTSWRIGWFALYSSNCPCAHPPILQIVLVQICYSAARNWRNSVPPRCSDDLCLLFFKHPSSMDLALCRFVRVFWLSLILDGNPELGTRQQNSDNVTMFSGQEIVDFWIISIFVTATPFWHWSLNIFSYHCSSVMFSRCRCREAKNVSHAQLWHNYLKCCWVYRMQSIYM